MPCLSWVHLVKSHLFRSPINFVFSSIRIETNDIQQLFRLIDPASFNPETDHHFEEGLLEMKIDEPVKLQLCFVLQHLCDYQLQYRIEGTIAFSEEFVERLQSVIDLERSIRLNVEVFLFFVFSQDQKRRYNVLKESSLPPALMAKKTREFRCPPKDQVRRNSSEHCHCTYDVSRCKP